MIIQSSRISRAGGYHYLEKHLLDKTHENDRIQILSGDRAVFADAQALAISKKCKYALRHLSISPEEEMSPRQLSKFIKSIDAEFGIGDHRPRLVVLHQKSGRVHFHIAISEVDPASGKVLDSRCDYARLEKLAREYESTNAERLQATRIERAAEKRSGLSSMARQKAERIAEAFDRTRLKTACSEGAQRLQDELRLQHLKVANGERGYILITASGQFVAAAHRATGMKKYEFSKFWEAYNDEIVRTHSDGNVTGYSSGTSAGKCASSRTDTERNRQSKLSAVFDHAAPKTADRTLRESFRAGRADCPPLAHLSTRRVLLARGLTDIDWEELLLWAEQLTAALMKIVIRPRELLSARIHHARLGMYSNASMDNSIGPTLRPRR